MPIVIRVSVEAVGHERILLLTRFQPVLPGSRSTVSQPTLPLISDFPKRRAVPWLLDVFASVYSKGLKNDATALGQKRDPSGWVANTSSECLTSCMT
jgi:hypothetical protein